MMPMSQPASLEAFFAQVRDVNPFLDNRVNGPSHADADVGEVHRAAFERLTELAGEARAARRGVGAVLWGEAGIGKSHLLSRLGRWAEEGPACFAYLHNLQAAPEQLPRSLLHAVVSLLTRGRRTQLHATPLFELVRAALLEAIHHEPGVRPWSSIEHAFHRLVDRWAEEGPAAALDRTVYDVLFAFFRSAWEAARGSDGNAATLAVRWLSGRGLDQAEAQLLGLPPARRLDEAVALEDDQQVKQVLVALTRLAACKRQTFLLAFDQVDNLEPAQFGALARFLEALIDSSPNLLAVTAGIQSTMVDWKESVIQKSAWDRLAQFELRLHRLSVAEAGQLVRARLERFLAPFADLPPVARAREADDLFPLGRAWHERFGRDKVEVRPRDAINAAREGWRQEQQRLREQGGPAWLEGWSAHQNDGVALPPPPPLSPGEEQAAVDRAVDEALADQRARLSEAVSAAPNADHLAGVLYRLLTHCREGGSLYGVQEVQRLPPPRRNARPTYDLSVRQQQGAGPAVRVGALVLTVDNATSAAGVLRRLVEDQRPLDRVVLVTDRRVGLPLGQRGREHLDDLRQRGPERFRAVELGPEDWADLEALQLTAAEAGDMDVEVRPGEVRPLTPEEAIASLHRRGRYLANRLVRALLAAEPAADLVGEAEALAL
jgi:hypothetical protein